MLHHATPKKREIFQRECLILEVAQRLLIQRGYHGLTMARIAEEVNCSKGTVYEHFGCKEEIIVALAVESVDKQRELVERAATFMGRPRERMVAVGVATQIFALLYTEEARIFQIMNGEALTQKISVASLSRLRSSGNATVGVISGILRDAIAQGDLTPPKGTCLEDLVFHFWLIGEGGKAASISWLPPSDIGIADPFDSVMRTSQLLGNGCGWQPLATEWDYDETRRRILREVFPKEAIQIYGHVP